MRYIATILFLYILPSLPAQAQIGDIINVYTDESPCSSLDSTTTIYCLKRIGIRTSNSPKSEIIITKEDIQQSGSKDLAQLLNSQNGITVTNAYGNRSSEKEIIFQGASPSETLILLNSVPVFNAIQSSPVFPTNPFDILLIPLANIERIVIIKGGQSTLQSVNGMAGSINIITTKIKHHYEDIAVNFSSTYGSRTSNINAVDISSDFIPYTFLHVSATNESAIGINERQQALVGSTILTNTNSRVTDRDGFDRRSISGMLNFSPTARLIADASIYVSELDRDVDDLNSTTTRNSTLSTGVGSIRYDFPRISLSSLYKFSTSRFKLLDSEVLADDESKYRSLNLKSDYFLTDHIHFSGGFEHQRLIDSDPIRFFNSNQVFIDREESSRINAPFLDISVIDWYKFRIDVGFRYSFRKIIEEEQGEMFDRENLDVFNNYYTFHTAGAYRFLKRFKLKSSYSQTSSQLETGDRTYFFDLGLTYTSALQTTIFSVRYLKNDLFIGNVFQSNRLGLIGAIDTQRSEGFELSGTLPVGPYLKVSAFYNYLDTSLNIRKLEDPTFAQSTQIISSRFSRTLRTPKHSGSLSLLVTPISRLLINIESLYTGNRIDGFEFLIIRAPQEFDVLDSYTIVNIYAEYTFPNNKLTLFGDIRNVLNEDFTERQGFNTIGITTHAGIRYSFNKE